MTGRIIEAPWPAGHPGIGLGSWPWRRARISGDGIALDDGQTALTYRELAGRVAQLASAMIGAGIEAGDRVVFLGPNSIAAFETLFATGLAGAIFVPLNTRLASAEIAAILADCEPVALVVAETHYPLLDEIQTVLPSSLELIVSVGCSRFDSAQFDFEQFVAVGGEVITFPHVGSDEPCVILYTSGTTASPKGVVLTHHSLAANTVNQLAHIDVIAAERALCVAPLFHVSGLCQITLPTFFKGGCVYPVGRFDPGAVLSRIERDRITIFSAVPTMLQMLCEHPSWPDTDLSSLRTVVFGGSPAPESVVREWIRRGVPLLQGYGMTEATAGVYMATPEIADRHPAAVGVPHFFTDVAILRDGVAVIPRDGMQGELVIRGPNMFAGYWNRTGTPDTAESGAWFRTGDVVRVADGGVATVLDRIKDVIISGGENIYPAEIEMALNGLPDVTAAAVVGVPDRRWGEVPVAFVVSSAPGFDETQARRRLGSQLARYKIPKRICVVDQLPCNAVGKVDRRQLRLWAQTTAGGEACES